jgi:hypothetical protein
MTIAFMMIPNAAPQATVNGTLYRGQPNTTVSVQSGDVAALLAIGWIALTARMLPPADTFAASVGVMNYTIQPDGSFWVAPGDVPQLETSGFTLVAMNWTPPATPTPTPTTFTLQMQQAGASFQVSSGASYRSDVNGQSPVSRRRTWVRSRSPAASSWASLAPLSLTPTPWRAKAMQKLARFYGTLEKIEPQEDGTVTVYGVASTSARDAAGEIVTPDAMKAAIPDYLAFGAIREMHEPKAAGTALACYVDENGDTQLAAHVVDPVAVQKVKAGVYKGLSIGGKVVSRDATDRTIITAIQLVEISLVDRPCNPDAVIGLWKFDSAMTDQSDPATDLIATLERALSAAKDGLDKHQKAQADALFKAWPTGRAKTLTELTKIVAESADLSKRLREADSEAKAARREAAGARRELKDVTAKLEKLLAEPAPARAAASSHALLADVRGVDKVADAAGSNGERKSLSVKDAAAMLESLEPVERADLLMRAAMSRPIPVTMG